MTQLLAHVQISTALALILGYFSAHAAALLLRAHAPDWLFGVTTHGLAVAAAVIPTVIWHPGDTWTIYLGNVVGALFMANQAHRTGVPWAMKGATRGLIGPTTTRSHRGDHGFAGLLLLAVVLFVAFGGLGFVWHLLWWGLLLALVIAIVHWLESGAR